MKKIGIILLSACLLLGTACEDYLDVNKNIDAPDYVDDYLYLSGVLQTYQDIAFDLHAVAPLAQMWSMNGALTSYGDYARHYNPLRVDAGAVIWRTVYFNHGMNLQNMLNEALEQEHWTLVGICHVLRAHSWDMLTKLYGEAPLKQFLDTELTSFDYDYQDVIYEQVRAWALEGVKYLEMEDKTNYGSKLTANDWVYAGDAAKWKKFAYAVLVRNLASLSNKSDFTTKYADDLIRYAALSFQSASDDAMVKVAGGSQSATYTAYNNYLGTARGNLTTNYIQNDYAVQVMTGTVPVWDGTGKRLKVDLEGANHEDSVRAVYYPYELAATQIICDTAVSAPGHFDPRVVAKLATASDPDYNDIDKPEAVKYYQFYGGQTVISRTSPQNVTVPQFYGRVEAVKNGTTTLPNDGKGRYLFHDEAPYVLSTCAEIKFCLAEAYWKKGDKANAYAAFKEGIKADLDFTKGQLRTGTKGSPAGGDKITAAAFQALADQYYAGPYVEGLGEANLTLSHIMMQKWAALFTWGAMEAWVDLRKYHYDIDYTGDYPSLNNGWASDRFITHKEENRADRIYKGFYLPAARDVEFRNATFNVLNEGSPMYRIRPRYNSEYVWNEPKLAVIKPVSGTADNYHCSIPWFAYPNGFPAN
ncbi:MAG: SusD/RagB family nutrient-binding outer membrane lipoprotein [Dysgonamonadaceae bacterium]|jgi:hypothetical protein|nr:SusD/RagB family nutrient-binding outer membrane lipoprotein [Dysgonamonadaceae bacterium]